jgi:hypothetical protein
VFVISGIEPARKQLAHRPLTDWRSAQAHVNYTMQLIRLAAEI